MTLIWVARFSDLIPQRTRLWSLLDADEHSRALRYRFEDRREAFICARGMLRIALGRCLNVAPESVAFGYGARGKPFVEGSLRFNLSHSEDLLLLAISDGQTLGVDVEQVRPMAEMTTVARSNFSTAEQAAFFALPEPDRPRGFYRLWTRKEAYIKATGDGFSLPLKEFDVSLDDPPRLLRGDDTARWSLVHLEPATDYIGALCIEGDPGAVDLRPFTV